MNTHDNPSLQKITFKGNIAEFQEGAYTEACRKIAKSIWTTVSEREIKTVQDILDAINNATPTDSYIPQIKTSLIVVGHLRDEVSPISTLRPRRTRVYSLKQYSWVQGYACASNAGAVSSEYISLTSYAGVLSA